MPCLHGENLLDNFIRMVNGMPWIAVGLSVLLGAVFSQQPVINGAIARASGSLIAASVFSVFITLCCLLALLPFSVGSLRSDVLSTLPWWSVLGGLIGVGIVAGGAFLAPILGAALFFVCLVAGQLFGSAIADHLGAFGLPVRPLSGARAIGLLLVFSGAWLVHRG
ncbi:MAG: transporter family-2 protein [bacterium]|jgi:transporter family-2 protein